MSRILLRLNILCTSPAKQCDTQNNDSPFTAIHRVAATYLFFNLPDKVKAWRDPYIKTFSTWSRVRLSFWISSQLDFLCTSAVIRDCAKSNNYSAPFTSHLFSCVSEFTEAKSCHRIARTSIWLYFLLWSILQQKFYRSDIRDVKSIIWSEFCYTAENDQPRGNKMGARTTAKKGGDDI